MPYSRHTQGLIVAAGQRGASVPGLLGAPCSGRTRCAKTPPQPPKWAPPASACIGTGTAEAARWAGQSEVTGIRLSHCLNSPGVRKGGPGSGQRGTQQRAPRSLVTHRTRCTKPNLHLQLPHKKHIHSPQIRPQPDAHFHLTHNCIDSNTHPLTAGPPTQTCRTQRG